MDRSKPELLANVHGTFKLNAGNALNIKASSAADSANVALTIPVAGVSFAPAATSGTTLLTVGPFSADVELTVAASGKVNVAYSFAGLSAAV